VYTEDNIDYVNGRLAGTIIRDDDNHPFYVMSVKVGKRGVFEVTGYKLKNSSNVLDYTTLPLRKMNLEPVPLGYVNFTKKDALYIMRKPMREDWRQGLRSHNVYSHVGYMDELPMLELHSTVVGDYPTYDFCSRQKFITAFCRDFACSNKQLCYKGSVVGDANGLSNTHIHLREYLEEMIHENP